MCVSIRSVADVLHAACAQWRTRGDALAYIMSPLILSVSDFWYRPDSTFKKLHAYDSRNKDVFEKASTIQRCGSRKMANQRPEGNLCGGKIIRALGLHCLHVGPES